jgi:hypothetical protein
MKREELLNQCYMSYKRNSLHKTLYSLWQSWVNWSYGNILHNLMHTCFLYELAKMFSQVGLRNFSLRRVPLMGNNIITISKHLVFNLVF